MSEIQHQLKPRPNTGPKDPYSTRVESSKPISPNPGTTPQTIPSTQTPKTALQTTSSTPTQDPSPKIAFRSADIGTQTARPKDYFAEQNQQTLTKKQAHSTKIRWLLIIFCGLVGVALMIGVIWWSISKKDETPAENKPYEGMSESERAEHNVDLRQEVYDAATKDAQNTSESNESDKAAAAEVFQQAANSAKNNTEANAIRVSQMRYLLEKGEYYDILEIGPSVCEDTSLDLATRMSCANIMAIAAYNKGDQTLYEYYDRLQDSLMDENPQYFQSGGQNA